MGSMSDETEPCDSGLLQGLRHPRPRARRAERGSGLQASAGPTRRSSARERVVVGHDIRLSSPEIAGRAVAPGLTDAGVDVVDIGLCGTEQVYFATFHLELDGGIMVTASHNPADYNGLKLVREEARPISARHRPGGDRARDPRRRSRAGRPAAARSSSAERRRGLRRAPAGLRRRRDARSR